MKMISRVLKSSSCQYTDRLTDRRMRSSSVNRRNPTRPTSCKAGPLLGQALGHQRYHSQIHHGFRRRGQPFIVFAQPTSAVQPAQGAFHNPTVMHHFKALGGVTPFDDLQHPSTQVFHPIDQFAGIPAIRPDFLQARQAVSHLGQYYARAIAVLLSRGQDHDDQDQAQGIDQQMSLHAFDLLSRIIPA